MVRRKKEGWATERAKKAAATRMARYGPDVFKELGRKGRKMRNEKIDNLPRTIQYEPLDGEPR